MQNADDAGKLDTDGQDYYDPTKGVDSALKISLTTIADDGAESTGLVEIDSPWKPPLSSKELYQSSEAGTEVLSGSLTSEDPSDDTKQLKRSGTAFLSSDYIRASGSTVYQSCRNCIAVFGRAMGSQTLDDSVKAELEQQVGRFKIWAGNLGVFAEGKASADYRFRNDEDVLQITLDMLQRLWKELLNLATLGAVAEESEQEIQDEDGSSSASDSTASLVISMVSEDLSEPAELHNMSSIFTASLDAVMTIISKLYRLTATIRKPQSHRENVRVHRFIEKEQMEPDEEYEQHVRWQVHHQLPDASPEDCREAGPRDRLQTQKA